MMSVLESRSKSGRPGYGINSEPSCDTKWVTLIAKSFLSCVIAGTLLTFPPLSTH